MTARLSYSPYGEMTIESGTVATPFCFNGKWGVMTEPNSLLYMQARFYSAVLRRFLNEDPSGFHGGLNLYGYCAGDPANLMDPFGLGAFGSSALGTYFGVNGFSLAYSFTVYGQLKVDTDGGWTSYTYNDSDYSDDGHTSGGFNVFGIIIAPPDGPTNVDANTDAYGTAPIYMSAGGFISVGDYAVYTNLNTGATITVPIMDFAPKSTGFGEGSVATGVALGAIIYDAGYTRSGTALGPVTWGDVPVSVTYYPGTAIHEQSIPKIPINIGLGVKIK